MSQFVSTSRHCQDIQDCPEWDIAETLLETLPLELSSSGKGCPTFNPTFAESCFVRNLPMQYKFRSLRTLHIVEVGEYEKGTE